MINFKT